MAAATVGDAKITSPTNPAYKAIFNAAGRLANDQAAATLMLTNGACVASAGNLAQPIFLPIFHFDNADVTVNALTEKFRGRYQLMTNATAPGTMTFIVGLYPVTVAGGTDLITPTLGTVVANSQATFTDPAGSSMLSQVVADFTVPADGFYAFGVVTNQTIANNSAVSVHAQLYYRNV